MVTQTSLDDQLWQVMRQDDNGNKFVMGKKLTQAEADMMVREFEARPHKQTYWKELYNPQNTTSPSHS